MGCDSTPAPIASISATCHTVAPPPSYPSDEEITHYLPVYQAHGMVLDQGKEGACTGFGLAAVVNYLRWEGWLAGLPENELLAEAKGIPAKVSPRMLYQLKEIKDRAFEVTAREIGVKAIWET